MPDLDPIERVAQLVRMLGSVGGERRNAFTALERFMHGHGITWSDVGNAIGGAAGDKFTKAEMQEVFTTARKQGVEDGIKIGMARAHNGCIMLPAPAEMARYCHERLGRLKDDKQRVFIGDMYLLTRRARSLSLGRLGYLASIYIQIGGRI